LKKVYLEPSRNSKNDKEKFSKSLLCSLFVFGGLSSDKLFGKFSLARDGSAISQGSVWRLSLYVVNWVDSWLEFFFLKCLPLRCGGRCEGPCFRGTMQNSSFYILQQTATNCNTLHHTVTHCTILQHATPLCDRPQHRPVVLWVAEAGTQDAVSYCHTLHCTATYCNTLQHAATQTYRPLTCGRCPVSRRTL